MKNIVVCGGAGFVGGHLVDRLLHTPGVERIVIADRDTKALCDFNPSPRLLINPGDLQNDTGALFQGCDTVFHLASNADISKAVEDPDLDFRDGTLVTRNILEGMRAHGCKRIIYFSGSGVYGDLGDARLYEDVTICRPISPYGASKLASEALISAYCAMFGMMGAVFRPANIVGPDQTHGVTFDFVRQLKEHPDHLDILGDGRQLKSYVDIDDVLDTVLAHEARCAHKLGFEIFNLSNEDPISVMIIALMAKKICWPNLQVELRLKGGDRGWAGDVPKVNLMMTKLSDPSDWKSSEEAIERSIRSML